MSTPAADTGPTAEAISAFVMAAHGDSEKVRSLLEADPRLLEERTALDETALAAAAHTGQRAIAEYLLAQGARTDLCAAAMLGEVDVVRAALAEDPTQARIGGAHGISILFHAALSGRRELCELLLGYGADAREGDGQQPVLHGAVYADAPGVAALLVAAGADPAARDFGGRTAEELARAMGRTAVAEIVRAGGR